MPTPLTERDRARKHVATVHELRRELAAEYLRDHPNRSTIADLHAAIGVNLKLADVHAQLATAEAVADLCGDLFTALRARADVILDREPVGAPS